MHKNEYIKYKNKLMEGGRKVEPIKTNLDVLYCDNDDDQEICSNNKININKFINSVKAKATKYCDSKKFRMIAGILHKNGDIVFSLATTSPMGLDVHSEYCIVQDALKYEIDNQNKRKEEVDFSNFLLLVCVNDEGKIKAPCGICREMLKHYIPNIFVILRDDIGGEKYREIENIPNILLQSKYLLPYPYTRSNEMNPNSITNQNISMNLLIEDKNANPPLTIEESGINDTTELVVE
jgi:cytidine deaminase